MRYRVIFVIAILSAFIFGSAATQSETRDDEKLSAEEIVARHVQSIGAAEDRATIRTRVITGTSLFTARSPGKGRNSGLSLLFSQGSKSVVAMLFSNPNYPHDKFGYDGSRVVISYQTPGVRSALGEFMLARTEIIKEGLLGGTLSTAWPLLYLAETRVRLEYAGKKKLDQGSTHVLRYLPRKGSEVEIRLFFDTETFRHVRTEYEQTLTSQMGAGPDASKENQTRRRFKLTEYFSDFREAGKLTLPHTYKLELMMERNAGTTYLAEWEMVFSKFSWNQPLEAEWFDVNQS